MPRPIREPRDKWARRHAARRKQIAAAAARTNNEEAAKKLGIPAERVRQIRLMVKASRLPKSRDVDV